MTGIGENTLAQPVKPPLRERRACLAKLVKNRLTLTIKRRSRVVQVFPSTGSLVRLAGAVMCEQDEIWQESRYFSEARMNELYDEGRARRADGPRRLGAARG